MALEKVLTSKTRSPAPTAPSEADHTLNISVVFTSVESTIMALRKAGALATSLNAQITLLVTQIVPYPLPLESPPVLLDWNERRFHTIAAESPAETTVRIYLCRDGVETLKNSLPPKSLVVIGGRQVWWPFTREKRLAMQLRHAGHEVIYTKTE
jgi:hypothetical protein